MKLLPLPSWCAQHRKLSSARAYTLVVITKSKLSSRDLPEGLNAREVATPCGGPCPPHILVRPCCQVENPWRTAELTRLGIYIHTDDSTGDRPNRGSTWNGSHDCLPDAGKSADFAFRCPRHMAFYNHTISPKSPTHQRLTDTRTRFE